MPRKQKELWESQNLKTTKIEVTNKGCVQNLREIVILERWKQVPEILERLKQVPEILEKYFPNQVFKILEK